MYFAIAQLELDLDEARPGSGHDMQKIVDKIRSRFRVSVLGNLSADGTILELSIAAIDRTENDLIQTLDAISKLCEDEGLGRILSEKTLLDHMDTIESNESEN